MLLLPVQFSGIYFAFSNKDVFMLLLDVQRRFQQLILISSSSSFSSTSFEVGAFVSGGDKNHL